MSVIEIFQQLLTANSIRNHAYIWIRKTGMRDLNKMITKNSGWVLHRAAGDQ